MMIEEIAPLAFKAMLDRGDDLLLLDVREQVELEICKLAEAVHIPMGEVPMRLHELPKDKLIVVMCHHGRRSMMVAQVLKKNGFDKLLNLDGGIDLYAGECDASMPRY